MFQQFEPLSKFVYNYDGAPPEGPEGLERPQGPERPEDLGERSEEIKNALEGNFRVTASNISEIDKILKNGNLHEGDENRINGKLNQIKETLARLRQESESEKGEIIKETEGQLGTLISRAEGGEGESEPNTPEDPELGEGIEKRRAAGAQLEEDSGNLLEEAQEAQKKAAGKLASSQQRNRNNPSNRNRLA